MPTHARMSRPAAGTAWPALLIAVLASAASGQMAQFGSFGSHAGDALGRSVAVLGDVDGDGVPDFVVGAPAATGAASAPGYALVLSGADGGLIHRLLTTGSADRFGWSVAVAGDVDADGVPDVLVGAPGSAPVHGEAQLFSGATGALLRAAAGVSPDSWDGFGFAVTGLGDVDGDGHADYAVGQPSLSGEQPGSVRVYGGADGGLLYALEGLSAGDGFGSALAAVGDVDGDTVPDLVVGASGGAYVRLVSGATGALLHHFTGPGAGYGACVAAAGDIDGDGTGDLAIGSPLFNGVDVMSGATAALLRRFETLGGSFGASIAALGDVDGDGTPDLLIGSPDDGLLGNAGSGSALVVSGQTGAHLYKFFGNNGAEHAGASLASLGDLDGDALPELLLGTPGDLVPGPGSAGSVKAYSGTLATAVKTYGFGCPNSFLITPVLDLLGDPTPGGQLTLSLTRLFPGTAALVFAGTGPGFQPLNNGCIVWVAPLLPATLVFPLGGFPSGADSVTVTGKLPAALPAGATLSLQCFVPDAFSPGAFASSNAQLLTLQ